MPIDWEMVICRDYDTGSMAIDQSAVTAPVGSLVVITLTRYEQGEFIVPTDNSTGVYLSTATVQGTGTVR